MLQINYLKENAEEAIQHLIRRNFAKAEELVKTAISVDEKRRETQVESDKIKAEANSLAKEIGQLMKKGEKEQAEKVKSQTAELKQKDKILSAQLADFENELQEILYQIPNIPHPSVPVGNSDEDNEEIARYGEFPTLSENAKPHWELIDDYDLIDFKLGNKVTGAGFPFYKGKGARLQRALVNFFLDEAQAAGYTEVQPPLLINQDSGIGTGQLPDKEGQMYHIQNEDFYLIPTAEVPITNMLRGEILNEKELPLKLTGYTPCFRREAGTWGAQVRGLNRLHQFDKVELVQIQSPEKSYETLEEMCEHVKSLLTKLELPFRVLRLCGGDLGFTSALTYDFEVYSAGQKRWLEVSSVSNFETFQANRMKLRYRDANNKKQLVHTLNGSALALPRIVASILENNQVEDRIKIPKALIPYTNFEEI